MMPDALIAPIVDLLDTIIPDPQARDAAKLELLRPEHGEEIERLRQRIAEADAADPFTRRARPGFLYVMYALLLWAIPMGLIAAVDPATAKGIAAGMSAYLSGIPEPLYALFGTGYLGYTVARSWGRTRAA